MVITMMIKTAIRMAHIFSTQKRKYRNPLIVVFTMRLHLWFIPNSNEHVHFIKHEQRMLCHALIQYANAVIYDSIIDGSVLYQGTLQFFHQNFLLSLAALVSNWEAPACSASALSSSSDSFWSRSSTLSTLTRMMSTTCSQE